ncbi:hypothetical protein DIPPA_01456 [Diplonema papillatum]|nr:hypothetical protein DIPPA_01456 [Diplonema papillatum]
MNDDAFDEDQANTLPLFDELSRSHEVTVPTSAAEARPLSLDAISSPPDKKVQRMAVLLLLPDVVADLPFDNRHDKVLSLLSHVIEEEEGPVTTLGCIRRTAQPNKGKDLFVIDAKHPVYLVRVVDHLYAKLQRVHAEAPPQRFLRQNPFPMRMITVAEKERYGRNCLGFFMEKAASDADRSLVCLDHEGAWVCNVKGVLRVWYQKQCRYVVMRNTPDRCGQANFSLPGGCVDTARAQPGGARKSDIFAELAREVDEEFAALGLACTIQQFDAEVKFLYGYPHTAFIIADVTTNIRCPGIPAELDPEQGRQLHEQSKADWQAFHSVSTAPAPLEHVSAHLMTSAELRQCLYIYRPDELDHLLGEDSWSTSNQ